MGRQARRRGSCASALTLVAWLLIILRLPAPASPAGAPATAGNVIARSAPNLIKYAQELAKKKAVRSGGRALIEKYLSSGSGDPGGQALTGIPAGAFDVAADGNSGGVYLSTMLHITYLQPEAYYAVRRALVSQIKSQEVNGSALFGGVFDLCYNLQAVAGLTFPKLTLVFDGSPTPTMELTTVNYFYKHTPTGLQCLTMRETPTDAPFSSILGSLLQTGTNMIYDIAGGSLTFEKGAASALSSQVPSSVMAMAPLYLAWVLLF